MTLYPHIRAYGWRMAKNWGLFSASRHEWIPDGAYLGHDVVLSICSQVTMELACKGDLAVARRWIPITLKRRFIDELREFKARREAEAMYAWLRMAQSRRPSVPMPIGTEEILAEIASLRNAMLIDETEASMLRTIVEQDFERFRHRRLAKLLGTSANETYAKWHRLRALRPEFLERFT